MTFSKVLELKKFLLKLAYNLIGPTLRFQEDYLAQVAEIKKKTGKNILFAVWHESNAACFWIYRHRGTGILLEDSPKGRVLEALAQYLGYKTFRIVDDPKDIRTVRATIALIKYLRKGYDGTIALDGPNGPYHVVKPGIFAIAKKSGHIILPVKVTYSHKFICFWRWDKYQIPLPFSKVKIQIGKPVKNEAELIAELNS